MLRLTDEQRGVLADKLFDVANVAVGAMVFGQFLSDGPFSALLALAGVTAWILLVTFAMVLLMRGARS